MITRRELLKSAIATATIRIDQGKGEAMEQRVSIVTLGVKDLADPDGLAWEVAWKPAWKIASDGSIEFQ
jgi:hypothetical protein